MNMKVLYNGELVMVHVGHGGEVSVKGKGIIGNIKSFPILEKEFKAFNNDLAYISGF
jgi:hypothetical protein